MISKLSEHDVTGFCKKVILYGSDRSESKDINNAFHIAA